MNPTEAFFHAVRTADLAQVETLLRADRGRANLRDDSGTTPLHLAARTGNLDLAWLLLRAGADPNGGGEGYEWRPVVHAAWEGHAEMVQLLIAHRADVSRSGGNPIHYAGQRKRKEICKLLVEAGAVDDLVDPPDPEALAVFRAAYSYDAGGLNALLSRNRKLANARDVEGRTPLHEAATNGDVESVTALIRAGVDVDAKSDRGQTALDRAVAHRHADVVKLLLAGGAACDIFTAVRFGVAERLARFLNTEPELVHARDALGRTPLQVAMLFGQKPAANLLLDRGAEDPGELGRRFLRGAVVRGQELRGILHQGLDMAGSVFTDVNLAQTSFENVNLARTTFDDVNLSGARLRSVNLAGVTIEQANLRGLRIGGVEVEPLIRAALAKNPEEAVSLDDPEARP